MNRTRFWLILSIVVGIISRLKTLMSSSGWSTACCSSIWLFTSEISCYDTDKSLSMSIFGEACGGVGHWWCCCVLLKSVVAVTVCAARIGSSFAEHIFLWARGGFYWCMCFKTGFHWWVGSCSFNWVSVSTVRLSLSTCHVVVHMFSRAPPRERTLKEKYC